MSGCNLSGPIDSSLKGLKHLSVIRLNQNHFTGTVPEFFGNFSNLTALHLSFCGLIGSFPQKLFQIMTLTSIDISYNDGLNGSFPHFPVNGSLQTVVVSNTNFSGVLPNSISNLRNLSKLDLSYSQFFGTLPNSISKLTELTYLDLSYNRFTGPIPSLGMADKLTHIDLSNNVFSGVIPSSGHFEGLQSLVSINLNNNSISGSIPSSLFLLPSLESIQLSNNQFNQLDELSNVSDTSILKTLDLSSNNLGGPIPASIFQLRRLSTLQLSSNKFNGPMLLNMIVELINLTTLDLSYNNLSVNVNVTDARLSSFRNISYLKLASCKLKTFPDFLRHQPTLADLDLSDNQIQGTIPNWIWKLESLIYLNLSHNLLTDLEQPPQNLSSYLIFLDLHANQLQGSIFFPKYVAYADYSNNKFSSVIPNDIGDYQPLTLFLSLSNNLFHGSIPDSLCNVPNLEVLDLSHNNISGTIPPCLMTRSETLGVLSLRENSLTGHIPDKFPASCALKTLDLNGNMLDGPIPKSLTNCTTLEVLDLGKNQIIDGFPCLLKNISTLRVLVLRKNGFHGSIGCPNTSNIWQMLQIVDLAFNNFTSNLSGRTFGTWEGMMPDEAQTLQFRILQYGNIYYQDRVSITSKGLQMKLVKILTIFTAIDFSFNHLEGPIPDEMMNFKALHILNLSNNAFTGKIPSSIGNLTQLESLDLSHNSLSGEIPIQLTRLSFLSFLDVSFNQLVGTIPTGTQIQSFPASSFIGNKGLRGPPLTTNCSDNASSSRTYGDAVPKSNSRSSIDWSFMSAELGFTFGLGLVILPLIFLKQWRMQYFKIVDYILCKIFPHLDFVYENRGGKNYRTLRWKKH